jgi:hypothetical protein
MLCLGLSVLVGFLGVTSKVIVVTSRGAIVTDSAGFSWELFALTLTGLGTLALGASTGLLAFSTWQDVRASQRTADAAVAAVHASERTADAAVAAAVAAADANALVRAESERRPRLRLEPDTMKVYSQVELTKTIWVRMLVYNEPGLKAAHGTRVILDHYVKPTGETVTIGSPSLGWSSAGSEDNAVLIFSGWRRVIDLGHFIPVGRVQSGDVSMPQWALELILPGVGHVEGDRERVGPGTRLRLVVGADDADAHFYDVTLGWQEHTMPQALLSSVAVRVDEVSESE